MATSAPPQLLHSFRRLATSPTLRCRPVSILPARQFTVSTACRAGNTGGGNIASDAGTQQSANSGNETGGSRDHALDKGKDGDPNVQSHESNAGRSAKAQDTGGQATRGKDERVSTAKAKKDHPEAPDVVIGMQDERGGKGA